MGSNSNKEMMQLRKLFAAIEDYEPALAEAIKKDVLETDGVLTGERQEVYGFSSWESFLDHLTFCLYIVHNTCDLRERTGTLYCNEEVFSEAAAAKALRFVELVCKDKAISTS